MAEPSIVSAHLRGLFPGADAATLRLLAGAEEAGGFLASDLHALRDLIELSGYQDRPAAYALVLALMAALEEGSLCVAATKAGLTHRLQDFAPADAPAWAERILKELDESALPDLIGLPGDQGRPILLHSTGPQRYLYFQKHLRFEQALHQAFLQRVHVSKFAPNPELPRILHDVLIDRPVRLRGQPLRLDVDQQAAVGLGLAHNLAIISGGPGTGKTSIVFTLLRCLTRLGIAADRIALAAPTGRAAQRLGDALAANRAALGESATDADQALEKVQPLTLHQLLGYLPTSGLYRRHLENPIPAEVVVVDEVSMVGIELMARLFEALRPDARLVLLGDKDQLPAVEAGAVLAHWLPGQTEGFSPEFHARLVEWFGPGVWPTTTQAQPLRDRVVVLKTNHRSQPDIRAAAQAINAQDLTLPDRLPALAWPAAHIPWADLARQGGCWLWPPASSRPTDLHHILDLWAKHAFLEGADGSSFADDLQQCQVGAEEIAAGSNPPLDRLFARLERYRLLTLLREGTWGAGTINAYLAQRVRTHLDRQSAGRLFAGAPVLITRNDRVRELNNGEVGLTVRAQDGGRRVVFRRHNQFITLPAEALPAHELGFALTVHKSQGSEYDEVLVILPPEAGRRLLTKELVYTAVTRAKQLAILCGTKETLRYAIGRKIVREAGVLGF